MTGRGFAGKILYVDLTRGETNQMPLDFDMAEKFIGGLGLAIKLAFDRITPGTDALSPGNPIVLGVGPFVGTSLPATSRVYAVTKFPSTGTIGWCGGGGVNFGCHLKNAGFDHLVIEGRSDRQVFLKINDGEVEICDGGSLWGAGIEETCEKLWGFVGHSAGVLAIGQAGENMVNFSMAYIDRISTIGRGGFGAVMGSKNLKAIVVRGSLGVGVADRKKYKSLSNALFKNIREYRHLKEWQNLGLVKSLPLVPLETYEKIKKRRIACVSCPIGDKDVIEIPDGEFQGLKVCSSSAVNLFTPLIYGFKDYREAVKCVATLDDLGLDMFEFFGILGFIKVLLEKRVITEKLDEEVNLASLKSMEFWAGKISRREGLGDVLARGYKGIIAKFGLDAKKYAPATIKGMFPYVGPRAPLAWKLFGTMELGQVLDPRGPHVGASGSPTYFAKRPLDVFPRHLNRMGVPEEAIKRIIPQYQNPGAEPQPGYPERLKVGALLKYSHCWFTILGCLGICARAQINRFYSASLCAELYEAVTGIKTDLQDLRHRANRVWTLLRLANIREGAFAEINHSLEKWFEAPGFLEYTTEQPLTPEDMENMIKDYHAEWGWNPETGIPTPETLGKLDLKF